MALRGMFVFLALAYCLNIASGTTLGVVYTEGGMVEGTNKKVGFRKYLDIFKGIPFAAPPGRFENPKPHPGWSGILKANEFKNRCLQMTLLQTNTRGGEDCLYLNIWVPQHAKVSTDLPVMVFIYGGAFLVGGSQGPNFLDDYLYSGEEIAMRGNVIVVTLNYRIGTLGFLSTGDSNGPGNYGLRDQHMAIAWVHRNIRAFGGDPNNLTIFGESAGSASVNLQILSPYNKGLIRRAISQSGVALSPWATNTRPLFWAEKIAEKVGCPTNDTAKMMACMRISDPVALTLAGNLQLFNLQEPVVFGLGLSPVVDGDFIPDHPANLYPNAADVDYIAGVNDMDGHFFAGFDVPSVNKKKDTTLPSDLYKLLLGLSKDKGDPAAKDAFDLYTQSWGASPSLETIKKTIVDVESDFLFIAPTYASLCLHNQHASVGKTYTYVFNMPSRVPFFPSWMGAEHAEDLQYVFGKPFTTPLAYFPRHRDVSKYLIAYWTNFARTGDPNKGESDVPAQWPAFTCKDLQYLEINNNIKYSSVKQKLRTRFVHFWADVYPTYADVISSPTP
ncbi:carboxyl ester lipase, tandem duplicate 2 [Polypterus senegalus]|uniref:carboxyl ester lipase, tandem duplicate 2 n=1 Tax=Polypterus senegalus TaxID=55291 RepID=UPI00196392B8|nr:carboxyl ester lipase, tandem duplicate 2 [Polypterus senegalus]